MKLTSCILTLLIAIATACPSAVLADATDDFREAFFLVDLDGRFTPPKNFQCVPADAEDCRKYEGEIGLVKMLVELEGRSVTRFYIGAEGIEVDRDILTTIEGRYGAPANRQESVMKEIERPELGMKSLATTSLSVTWLPPQGKIVFFSKEPSTIVFADGRTKDVEPPKTSLSGERIKPQE